MNLGESDGNWQLASAVQKRDLMSGQGRTKDVA